MAEVFSILWMVLSFIVGILWSIVWFVLSDLLSTLAWIGIFIWLGFVLRYRSFSLGSLAVIRYARYALAWLWRWIRGRPGESPLSMPEPRIVREYRHRVPLGHASVSEQMNVLLLLLIIIMANV